MMAERTGPLVVFDVETQNLFEHVGGPQNAHKLLVSVAVSYDVDANEYRTFTHDSASDLVEQLFGARLVVGYNTLKFDYRVLRPYTKRRMNQLPSLDLFDHLYRRTNYRSKLDTVASETLGEHKTGHGLEAYEWWKAGDVQRCIDYCREDVRLTYEVYRYGKENGAVFTRDPRGRRTRVAVMW
jgi:DEAD/DEAH box helicase domain-containing protein